MRALFLALVLLTTAGASPLLAGSNADLTRRILESGAWQEGEDQLSAAIRADPKGGEARFGLGMVRFVEAVETFGRHQFRYGLQPVAAAQVPFFRLPVPPNPQAERLTYDTQRVALGKLLGDLASVDAALTGLDDGDVKIVVDLERVRLDFTGAGRTDPSATLMSVVRALESRAQRPASDNGAFEVAFDRGDALWLRGYTHLLSAGLEFLLAYDWRDTFDTAGGLFYPRLRAFPNALSAPVETGIGDAGTIADVIALIHEIRWPLAEPARLGAVRAHLKQVVDCSRRSWAAILAETDDDREWIPGPQQKNGVLPGVPVTKERVDAWLAALDEFDAALDGRKLVPHWRLRQGFNLRRVFDEPRPFDLVLWTTGHAALPYLEAGPVLEAQTWADLERVFQGNLMLYALYFN